MSDASDHREALIAQYGASERVRDDIAGQVLVFRHNSREAAEAYASANRDYWGHPSHAELREGAGWVSVVDLRPAITRIEAEVAHV